MNRQAIRSSYRAIIVVGLTITIALSANVAMAAHQMIEKQSGSLELQPTEAAGDATGQIGYRMTTGEDGDPILHIMPQFNKLENPENIMVLLVDEDNGRVDNLGRGADLAASAWRPGEDLRDLDSIYIVRPWGSDNEEQGPAPLILFKAELPHDQQ